MKISFSPNIPSHIQSYPKLFRNHKRIRSMLKSEHARILINFVALSPTFFFFLFFFIVAQFLFSIWMYPRRNTRPPFSTTFQLSILGNFERRSEFRTKAGIRSASADTIFKTTPENSDGLCPPSVVNLPLHLHLKPVRVARRTRTLLQSCPVGMHPLYSSFFFFFFRAGNAWGCIEGGRTRGWTKSNRWNPITFKMHERLTALAICISSYIRPSFHSLELQ